MSRHVCRCDRIIGHVTAHRMVGYILSGSFIVTFGVSFELLRSWGTNGKVHDRWHGTSPCDSERTIALWTNALRAYEGRSSELIPPGSPSREPVHILLCTGVFLLELMFPPVYIHCKKHIFPTTVKTNV